MLAQRIFSTVRPIRLAPLAVAALLAFAAVAHAQDAATGSAGRIEQQMTPEQFKAAGLDQLNAEQLGNLNAWLNRTLDVETTKAAATAEKKVKDDHRGFVSFGSSEPISARIAGEFRGFGQGRNYTLDNGQVWEQTDNASLSGVRLQQPQVTIKPGMVGSVWYLSVEGYNTKAKVQRVK